MKNTTNRKILKDLKSLQKVVRKEKGIGKIVAMISGSFDLLHYGHIEILESIKTKERTLIVLLNSDKSVRTYKGIGRPVINEWERTLSLAALSCVDYVFVFNDLNPVEIIKSTKPQEYWNGTDWSEECVEKEVVRSYGGILKIHNRGNHSTSKLIEKIIDANNLKSKKMIIYQTASKIPVFSSNFVKTMKKNNFEFMRVKSKENFERIFIKLALKKNVSLNKSWSISDNKVFLDSAKKVNLRTIDLKTNDKIGGTNLVKNESRIKKIILGHNL